LKHSEHSSFSQSACAISVLIVRVARNGLA
jgi:hypothetical protein